MVPAGAVVFTISVEIPAPPEIPDEEKLQVVFAGNSEQLRATGRLNPVAGVTVTVNDAVSPV
jgi:hypothetical protein